MAGNRLISSAYNKNLWTMTQEEINGYLMGRAVKISSKAVIRLDNDIEMNIDMTDENGRRFRDRLRMAVELYMLHK